ncbi:hypothetical protein [Bacillus sp. V5-8f]|uniref:hypothetical protein n=1 Tax=Bacillus sp. V5-8f TaxID=2053044 RepID=UPI000C776E2E|nr:hypothetical protein [Bacillus sp. V5-8f]PLT32699.1 hypothetical protein CUU64_17450 [Bacillus sp. V5-8f]
MIDPKLIESIVREVLGQIETNRESPKSRLLVISKQGESIAKELSILESYWNVVSGNIQENDSLPDVQQAVFLNVDQTTLVKAALGFTDTLENKRFVQLMTMEIPISFVLDQTLQKLIQTDGNEHRYSGYLEHIRAYKNTIESFGVTFLRLEELKPLKESKPSHDQIQRKPSKTLITQEKVDNHTGTELVVKQGTIITPLAMDKARELGIKITFL